MKFLRRIRLREMAQSNQNPSTSTPSSSSSSSSEMEQQGGRGGDSSRSMEETGITTTVTTTTSSSHGPPADDVCPICFADFVVPCRAACGHWFCGGCILEYWNHVSAFHPCKCPMCSRQITKLTPDSALSQLEDAKVVDLLRNVQQYNRLFVGGAYGVLLQVSQFPLFIKRVIHTMMDPDRPVPYLCQLRLIAVLIGALYTLSPDDILPKFKGIHFHHLITDYLDCSAIVVSYMLYLVGVYLRRRRLRHVRELVVVEPH